MNWQCYFDNDTLEVGYKMYKHGALCEIVHCGNPFRICTWMDETMERKRQCRVEIDIDRDSHKIKNAECTCATATLTDRMCRHMAALMYGWEEMKTHDRWNEVFHGYKDGTKEEILGIKYDIDQDFAEYESRMAECVGRGADVDVTVEYWFREMIYFKYIWDSPFRRIKRRGCFVSVFELYRYILEKIVKLKYCNKMYLELSYSTVAREWLWCLEAGNYEEKAEVKKLLDEYVKLPKDDYRHICAKEVKRRIIDLCASESYKRRRKIFEYLKVIPQGYVATRGSICDYINCEMSSAELSGVLNRPDIENEHLRYKVVKANGELSKYFTGMDDEEQRRLLERDGVEFLQNGRVDMESCLY